MLVEGRPSSDSGSLSGLPAGLWAVVAAIAWTGEALTGTGLAGAVLPGEAERCTQTTGSRGRGGASGSRGLSAAVARGAAGEGSLLGAAAEPLGADSGELPGAVTGELPGGETSFRGEISLRGRISLRGATLSLALLAATGRVRAGVSGARSDAAGGLGREGGAGSTLGDSARVGTGAKGSRSGPLERGRDAGAGSVGRERASAASRSLLDAGGAVNGPRWVRAAGLGEAGPGEAGPGEAGLGEAGPCEAGLGEAGTADVRCATAAAATARDSSLTAAASGGPGAAGELDGLGGAARAGAALG